MGLLGKNRSSVVYDSEIAEVLGINEAIILGRIIWSIDGHMERNELAFFKNKKWWMYDTREDLSDYSKLTDKQIRPVLKKLREKKIIETGQFDNKFGVRRNWFSIDIKVLFECLIPIGTKGPNTLGQKGPIEGDKRAQYIGTKGPNTSLLTESLSESLSESLTNKNDLSPLASVHPIPKKSRAKKIITNDPEDLEIAKLWQEYASKATGGKKFKGSWTQERLAEDIAKVRMETGINDQGFRDLLAFVQNPKEWWSEQLISPISLLNVSKTNGFKKIENIHHSMKKGLKNGHSNSIDLSADNGKFSNSNDDRPW